MRRSFTGFRAAAASCAAHAGPPLVLFGSVPELAPPLLLFGSPFVTWRGIPLVPSNKVQIVDGKTNIFLLRTGQTKQGVVGLYQPNLPGEQGMGLSVRFMGINEKAIASYLVSLYCSLAVLTEDALGVLENVQVGSYYDASQAQP